MKRLAFIISLFFIVSGYSQAKEDIYSIVEVMPDYPGGIKQLISFIQKNIRYPKDLNDKNIGGKVHLRFVVRSTGKVDSISVLKSGGFPELDQESIRILSLMSDWTPGSQNGKPVNVYYNIPISFALDTPYYIKNVSNKNKEYQESMLKIADKDLDNALLLLNKCLESNPDDLDAIYNKGVICYYKKEKKEACKNYKTLVEKADDNSTIGKNSKKYLEKYCN